MKPSCAAFRCFHLNLDHHQIVYHCQDGLHANIYVADNKSGAAYRSPPGGKDNAPFPATGKAAVSIPSFFGC